MLVLCYVHLCLDVLDREDTDMTALVSSLVQLILDDHCRTVDGFQDLIDREWTALGHPWLTRYGASSVDKVSLEQMRLRHCIDCKYWFQSTLSVGVVILQLPTAYLWCYE